MRSGLDTWATSVTASFKAALEEWPKEVPDDVNELGCLWRLAKEDTDCRRMLRARLGFACVLSLDRGQEQPAMLPWHVGLACAMSYFPNEFPSLPMWARRAVLHKLTESTRDSISRFLSDKYLVPRLEDDCRQEVRPAEAESQEWQALKRFEIQELQRFSKEEMRLKDEESAIRKKEMELEATKVLLSQEQKEAAKEPEEIQSDSRLHLTDTRTKQRKDSQLAEDEGKAKTKRGQYQTDLNQLNLDKESLQKKKKSMFSRRAQHLRDKVHQYQRRHALHENELVKLIARESQEEMDRAAQELNVISQADRYQAGHPKKSMNGIIIIHEEKSNYHSCREHARAGRKATDFAKSQLQKIHTVQRQTEELTGQVLRGLDNWFANWDGHDWKSHEQEQENKAWELIQKASPLKPASPEDIGAVVDAWNAVAIELQNWIQNTSSDDSVNDQVVFDLEDLARIGGFPDTVKHMKQIMDHVCIRPDVQESLVRKLEENASIWARKRMVHHVLQAYQRVHGQCPQWDFSGQSLEQPVVPVAEALPTIRFPHLDLPKFSEVREKLSEKLWCGIQGYAQKRRAREAFPLEIPPNSPLERKLTQGPGRALLKSLEKSWDAEFARAQEPENLAKHVFEDQASRKSFGELIFQEALDLLENLSDAWQKLLMTLSHVPATAAGEAFKALQVTHAAQRPQRGSAVALLAAPPGQHPDLKSVNPFFQTEGTIKSQESEEFVGFPRWTHRDFGQIPEQLRDAISEVLRLQGLTNSVCQVAKELGRKDDVSATLQRQVADLIERPWPRLQAEWIQFEWEQQMVCRPIQLHVATKMASEEFDKKVLQLNMGEGKSKVILFVPQSHLVEVVYQQWCHAIEKDAISQTTTSTSNWRDTFISIIRPLLCAAMADGRQLVRVTCLKDLLQHEGQEKIPTELTALFCFSVSLLIAHCFQPQQRRNRKVLPHCTGCSKQVLVSVFQASCTLE